ncbi:hypothetical protein IJG04_02990 [Candidatus Saccharibacteria bacterium]|nr:hypothetical protein [Candidatus Saccharibacteria bacterium]
MKTKMIKILIMAVAVLGFAGAVGMSAPVLAEEPSPSDVNICDLDQVPDSVKAANGCPNTSEVAELPNVVRNILNAIIGVMGLVAVVFVVVGGIHYITSTGDATKVKKARDTILYSVIGLVICALAFAIVNFTVDTIINQSVSNAEAEAVDEE